MNLYDIKEELLTAIEYGCDPETGEQLEGYDLENKLNELSMKLDDKIENIGAYIKNLRADSDAFGNEIDVLKNRKKAIDNKINRLTEYLSKFMKDNEIDKLSTPKVKISFRKSQKVNVTDINKLPKKFISEKVTIEPIKTLLKQYLKTNKLDGAELLDCKNINIK